MGNAWGFEHSVDRNPTPAFFIPESLIGAKIRPAQGINREALLANDWSTGLKNIVYGK